MKAFRRNEVLLKGQKKAGVKGEPWEMKLESAHICFLSQGVELEFDSLGNGWEATGGL